MLSGHNILYFARFIRRYDVIRTYSYSCTHTKSLRVITPRRITFIIIIDIKKEVYDVYNNMTISKYDK